MHDAIVYFIFNSLEFRKIFCFYSGEFSFYRKEFKNML